MVAIDCEIVGVAASWTDRAHVAITGFTKLHRYRESISDRKPKHGGIYRHRKVESMQAGRPRRSDATGIEIAHQDRTAIGHVDEKLAPKQAEAFRMSGKKHTAEHLVSHRIDDGEPTSALADHIMPISQIDPDIIGIVAKRQLRNLMPV